MKKALIILFLLIGSAMAAGLWFWQKNVFGTDKVTLEILAPEEMSLGEEIAYVVKYKNNASVRLEQVTLLFEYPQGSLPSGNGNGLRSTKKLPDINPGQELSQRFLARLFGKEGEIKEARATLTYTPKNLNASFRSETTATTVISLVPLSFELDLPSKAQSSQQFEFDLNYFSHSSYPLSDLRIRMEYPSGFTFQGASVSPIGDNEWKVAVLNKAEGGRITIKGTLEGETEEVKLFSAMIGSWREGQFVVLKEAVKGVELTNLNLKIVQLVNGTEESQVFFGDSLHYEILFRNVGDRNLENLFVIVDLEGRAFDLESVKVEKGDFQKGDNSITWEAGDVPRLRFLGKGEEGKIEFWVKVQENLDIASPQEKNFVLKDRILFPGASQEFEVKIASRLEIAQTGFYQDEVFGNQGPIPPKAGVPTSYTVIWQVKNIGNDLENVKVKAQLGQGVKLTGDLFPEGAPVSFDPISREVVWQIGSLASGAGFFDSQTAPSAAFQVELTPTILQKGKVVELISEAIVTADDAFIEQSLSSVDDAVDTTLLDDDTVSEQQGIVQ